jgi:hypothetical protein
MRLIHAELNGYIWMKDAKSTRPCTSCVLGWKKGTHESKFAFSAENVAPSEPNICVECVEDCIGRSGRSEELTKRMLKSLRRYLRRKV